MSLTRIIFSTGEEIQFKSHEEADEWVRGNLAWMTGEERVDTRRTRAAVNACQGISTDRLEKMVPGTLANLLDLNASRLQLTEAQIAEIIDKRMVKACYEPMGKEIAALIVAANLLTLKGEK